LKTRRILTLDKTRNSSLTIYRCRSYHHGAYGTMSDGLYRQRWVRERTNYDHWGHGHSNAPRWNFLPENASLILCLVQGDVAKSVDVTVLSEPLEYDMFIEHKYNTLQQLPSPL